MLPLLIKLPNYGRIHLSFRKNVKFLFFFLFVEPKYRYRLFILPFFSPRSDTGTSCLFDRFHHGGLFCREGEKKKEKKGKKLTKQKQTKHKQKTRERKKRDDEDDTASSQQQQQQQQQRRPFKDENETTFLDLSVWAGQGRDKWRTAKCFQLLLPFLHSYRGKLIFICSILKKKCIYIYIYIYIHPYVYTVSSITSVP